MLACGHRKELGNLVSVFVILIKSCEINNSSDVFESPPQPQTIEQAVVLQKPPPTEHLQYFIYFNIMLWFVSMFTKPSVRPSVCGRFHANGFQPPKKTR